MFNSPSDFANAIQDLSIRAHTVSAFSESAATTVAQMVVGVRGTIRSFRARIIDAGTTGSRNVMTLAKKPAGVATVTDLLTIGAPTGTDATVSGLPAGASVEVEPGDVLLVKGPTGNGAVDAYSGLDVDQRFGE